MSLAHIHHHLQNILPIIVGAAIYAFGLHYFVIPNELMEGGITGIALLLLYAAKVPPSVTTLALNLPLFLLGWKMLNSKQISYTVIGALTLSFFLWIMEVLIHIGWIIPFEAPSDYFLVTLYAGVTMGAGLGIVFRFGGTTGGSDIIARIGHKLKGWSVGKIILTLDGLIISFSLFYIPLEKILYTFVAVFITSKMIDFIADGAHAAKAFTIITDKTSQITESINHEIERGVTLIPAKGAFTQKNKYMIYCIVYRHESRRLRTLVHSIDAQAFIIIQDVQDVLGEGFQTE